MFDRDAEPANPIEALVCAALRELDNLAEEHGWDAPASLWFAVREIVGERIDTKWMPRQQIRAPRNPGDPSTIDQVATIARTIKDRVAAGDMSRPEGFFAVALVTEGWVGVGESTTTPSKRPDRVEARLIAAVDTAGINYHHMRVRNAQQGSIRIDRGEANGLAVGGTISDALHQIAEALTE